MIIVLLGASGSGKSTIERQIRKMGYGKVVSCTTRKAREKEIEGVDYHFISDEKFEELKSKGLFAEHDEYSQGRKYGSLVSDYSGKNIVTVLTPNGLKQLKEKFDSKEIFPVLVNANLGTRMLRYIKRVGLDKFTFDDKNEISARVERDYGMFLGVERDVKMVVNNDFDANITEVAKEILKKVEELK